MATVTLQSIQAAADAKYGATVIELGDGDSVELRNLLRISKAERKAVQTAFDRFKDEAGDDVDEVDAMREILKIVAKDAFKVDKLFGLIGDDLAVVNEVFSSYMGDTQAGEASPSQS